MTVGGSALLVGTLLPWVRTGGRRRHSYDLFVIVERLGFAPDGPAGTALRWWPLVPLLTTTAVVVAWWGWPRWGGAVGVVAAIYAGGTGVAVASAASSRVVALEAGAVMTALGGAVLLAGSVLAIAARSAVSSRGAPT